MALHRELFPATAKVAFFNNAAESPLNTKTKANIDEYLATVLEAPHTKLGHAPVRDAVRTRLAGLLGGDASEYACTSSTGHGLAMVAAGIEWQEGDNVVYPADEHWNNTFPWLALREKGVEVRVCPLREDNALDFDALKAMVDARTRVVAVAHVQFATGYRADLKAISAVAHAHGALFVVDGIQGAGVCPLNVVEDGVDVMAVAGFKWLFGMPGTGFLYVKKEVQARVRPSMPGMYAAGKGLTELTYHDDARQYETGNLASALFHGWAAGLDLVASVGVDAIYARCLRLVDRLAAGLKAKPGVSLRTPLDDPSARSAILVATTGTAEGNAEVCARLKAAGVIVADRGAAGVRISPNFFNTEEEVDKLLAAW
eukprot:TRINITY_DN13991_c0_g1_i1.p1 TRINITY_DN13991_c0_g1~~TRINITY_DN13991_c0_g1_i1.p1  ORF type:complete len:371 (+),score=144.98 TRINITY_DN13991_c0_g1_i1:46-1158(+)